MVKYALFFFTFLQISLYAGEFVAAVNRNEINVGDSIVLSLTLKDVSAQGTPSFNDLRKLFHLHSQQQLSNMTFINGQLSSSTTWKVGLTTQQEGEITIPSISINTSEGILSSTPIQIKVVKGAAVTNQSSSQEIVATAELSTTKPYKNQPFFVTVRLLSSVDLVNLTVQKLAIEDAIVEENGDPKVYRKNINGMEALEFSYLVTPLKSGNLKIPSITIQGGTPVRRKPNRVSFFDDDFEPFMMTLSGFDRLQPFNASTKEINVEVQPAPMGVHPWLPAVSLKIEEIWDSSQQFKVGEQITRGFKITAEGLMSNQLPSLEKMMEGNFKVYADKPKMSDQVNEQRLIGVREEQYTLIPQKAGNFKFPELSIEWWDVSKNEKAVTTIPSRTIYIDPASVVAQVEIETQHVTNIEEEIEPVFHLSWILYGCIAILSVLLLSAIVWAISLQRRVSKLSSPPSKERTVLHKEDNLKYAPPKKDKKEKLPDLNPT